MMKWNRLWVWCILIAVMTAALSACATGAQPADSDAEWSAPTYAKPVYLQRNSMRSDISVSLLWDNPIDKLYASIPSPPDTMRQRVLYGLYCSWWRAELEHAYDGLLALAHPDFAWTAEMVEESQRAFFAFVDVDAAMQGYAINSNAFGDEGGSYHDSIFSGSIQPGTESLIAAEHYRRQTLMLMELLVWHGGEASAFIFREEEALALVRDELLMHEDGHYE